MSDLHHFQQYFGYILVVSFIGGENQITRRTPSTCRRLLANVIEKNSRIHLYMD
jgi:hypothetical protein